jgi:hypothetical protein
MGIECPKCGIHGAYVSAITATGEPARTNKDIIARKLSCGHVVGNQDYMKFRDQLATLEETEANQIRAIQEAGAATRLEIWAKITVGNKGA